MLYSRYLDGGVFMNKLMMFLRKLEEIIRYLFFGVMTTAVNYMVYLPCYNWLRLPGAVSNVVAWVVSVAFAFLTNKLFVFKSREWSVKVAVPELVAFVGCRAGSGLLETAIIFLTVDCLRWNGNIIKLAASVLVVILNYVASKLLIFRKK